MFNLSLNTIQKIRLATALQRPVVWSRRALGRGAVIQCRRRNIFWELDLNEGIDFSIFLLGRFEPSTSRALDRLVRGGDHVIDVGANIGAHTLPLAARVGPAGKVVAVEPTAYAYSKLQRNVALNARLSCQTVLRQAMLAKNSDVELDSEIFSSWPLGAERTVLHPVHRAEAKATTGASVRTLDDLVLETSPHRLDLIKIDVDGYECGVLEGAQKALSAFRPTVVLELAPYALVEKGRSLEELLGLLLPHGYRLYDEKTGERLPSRPEFIVAEIPSGGSRNAVARVD